jgi:hypothetical protein
VRWDWVHLVRRRPLYAPLYQSRMIHDDECGAVSGIRTGRGNRNIRRKPAPVPLCPPQIPHDLTWSRTRAAAVGSRWLTAWAMARRWNRLQKASSHKCLGFARQMALNHIRVNYGPCTEKAWDDAYPTTRARTAAIKYTCYNTTRSLPQYSSTLV